jgi:hypothetical protein
MPLTDFAEYEAARADRIEGYLSWVVSNDDASCKSGTGRQLCLSVVKGRIERRPGLWAQFLSLADTKKPSHNRLEVGGVYKLQAGLISFNSGKS